MRFIFPCDDYNFELGRQSGVINGGTSFLWHLAHTLRSMGHEAELVSNGSDFPDCDYLWIQSEWYGIKGHLPQYERIRRMGGKIIVVLGHFKGGVYYDPLKIDADYYVSTWKGEVVDSYPKPVYYFPHAYCDVCDDPNVNFPNIPAVFFGNTYPLRDEHWFSGLPITRKSGVMPNEVSGWYRNATICPNIHGDFQKGIVSAIPSTLADVSGQALNERTFQIVGAGGFEICDYIPLMEEHFTPDELIWAKTKKEYREKFNYFMARPEERLPYIERGKARVMKDHTYRIRLTNFLNAID